MAGRIGNDGRKPRTDAASGREATRRALLAATLPAAMMVWLACSVPLSAQATDPAPGTDDVPAAMPAPPVDAPPAEVSPEEAERIVDGLREAALTLAGAVAAAEVERVREAAGTIEKALAAVPPVTDPLVTTRDRSLIDGTRRAIGPLLTALSSDTPDEAVLASATEAIAALPEGVRPPEPAEDEAGAGSDETDGAAGGTE